MPKELTKGDIVRVTVKRVEKFASLGDARGMLMTVDIGYANGTVQTDYMAEHENNGRQYPVILWVDEYEHIGDLAQLAYYAGRGTTVGSESDGET